MLRPRALPRRLPRLCSCRVRCAPHTTRFNTRKVLVLLPPFALVLAIPTLTLVGRVQIPLHEGTKTDGSLVLAATVSFCRAGCCYRETCRPAQRSLGWCCHPCLGLAGQLADLTEEIPDLTTDWKRHQKMPQWKRRSCFSCYSCCPSLRLLPCHH